jgi:regulator of replication initiation timing
MDLVFALYPFHTVILYHRLHELLIENDELKQKLDERESERTSKMNEMEDRTREIEGNNQYLQQLVNKLVH